MCIGIYIYEGRLQVASPPPPPPFGMVPRLESLGLLPNTCRTAEALLDTSPRSHHLPFRLDQMIKRKQKHDILWNWN